METNNSVINKIFSKRYTPYLILGIFGFVLYFQAFLFNFSFLDDNSLILNSGYFLSNLANIPHSFLTDVFHLTNHTAFYYRPLLSISFILDYQIGGLSPFIYHFSSVLVHLLAGFLLFSFLKKLNYKKELALFFSMIFLAHPALSQAVAWIPGRNDSLLLVFILATFIFFLKYLEEEKVKNLVWALIFFACGVFTKESAVLILPVAFFYFYFVRKENRKELSRYYFFIGTIPIILLWFLLRHIALSDSVSITLIEMFKSVFFNFPAIIQFTGKIFLPFNLSVLPIMRDTTFIYGIIAIVFLLLALFMTKQKRYSFILFGFLWFFAFLLPSFIRPNSALVADFIEHRLYVPIVGIFLVLLETSWVRNINFNKKKTILLASLLILTLSGITLVHSRVFANRTTFWQNAVENSPDYPLAHRNLGAMEYLDGNFPEAEKEFKKALELNPEEAMAHNNLGLIYAQDGKFTEAETEYKKELEVNPYYDNAYYNLGLLYYGNKDYEKAEENWEKTLSINPNFLQAIEALATVYTEQNKYTQAKPYIEVLHRIGMELPSKFLEILNR